MLLKITFQRQLAEICSQDVFLPWEACRWGSGCKRLQSHNIPHTHWLPETSDGKTTHQFVCSQQKPFHQPHCVLTTRSQNNHSCLEYVLALVNKSSRSDPSMHLPVYQASRSLPLQKSAREGGSSRCYAWDADQSDPTVPFLSAATPGLQAVN